MFQNNDIIFGPLNWVSQHIVTLIMLAVITSSSIFLLYFKQYAQFIFPIISLFVPLPGCYGATVIMLLLMSGIEVSVGSFRFAIWIFLISISIFLSRFFIPLYSYGVSYLPYSQFLTFLIHHKPVYYFKIKMFKFTDTHFYIISMIQYIVMTHNFYDLISILIINCVLKLFFKLIGLNSVTNVIRTTDIGAEFDDI